TGYHLGTYGAADATTFTKLSNPKYIAYRHANSPSPSDPLYAVTQKAGQPVADTASSFFGVGYAMPYVVKAAFSACGSNCSIDAIQKALEAGPVDVPNNALVGPLQFTAASHDGLGKVQYF